ncbi:MAG: hypothetical protein RJQ08_05975 [Salinisphaeraceae bacterium]
MDAHWAWVAAIGLGLFHGLNPGMGWLFAVSSGLQAGRGGAVWQALWPIGGGHLLAMAAVLVPVALLDRTLSQDGGLQVGAALLLIGFGLYKLWVPRHPRILARVGPRRLTLWSFLMATAHGAGLMLVPAFLGLGHAGHHAGHAAMLPTGVAAAVLMVAVHTLAMILAAGLVAWLVYRYLGLRLLRSAWLNTDYLWAVTLIIVGGVALVV